MGQSGCSPGLGDIQEGSETDLHHQLSGKMGPGGGVGWGGGGGGVRARMVALRIPASYTSHGTRHCHKREPVSTTAVYMHAKSIFKDKRI